MLLTNFPERRFSSVRSLSSLLASPSLLVRRPKVLVVVVNLVKAVSVEAVAVVAVAVPEEDEADATSA